MVVGTDGQPRGPPPHIHILPCPYDTRPWRADSLYSRGTLSGDRYSGERMRNPLWGRGIAGPLWSPVRCPLYTHLPI